VLQDKLLGPVLYLLYAADLFVVLDSTIAIYTDDKTVLMAYNNHIQAFLRLQQNLYHIQKWFKKWRIKANGTKWGDIHYTHSTIRREMYPSVILNSQKIPQAKNAKYLGLHLDRRLNWKKHIYIKCKQLRLQQNVLAIRQ